MNVRTYLALATLVSSMLVPGLALSQDENVISGKNVPVDQLTEIQYKCDQLRDANKATATPGADVAPTKAAAPPPAGTPASADAAQADNTTTPKPGTAGWTDDGTRIDLERLTVALCVEGSFLAPAK